MMHPRWLIAASLLGALWVAPTFAQTKPRLHQVNPLVDPESGAGRIPAPPAEVNAAERALTAVPPTPTVSLGSSTGRLPGDNMLTPGPPHVPLP